MRGISLPTSSSVTICLFAIYGALLLKQSTTPNLPADPSALTFGLNFTQAYWDIHQVASRPHPYNSYANDVVRSYLLKRLKDTTYGHQHIEIDDDVSSTASWVEGNYGVSFEGTNILVRVEGTDEKYRDQGGVLFSTHYDSVSTAPGVTDVAIGVASLLALVEYLATHRVKRTAVFNFNNGEEDGLNGAHAFLEHPWSKITNTFLNLEGAGAGGRPLLFRSTSLSPIRNYVSPAPHGTVISADAFLRGVVRSGTDFAVYLRGLGNDTGMEGIDIAFYEGRALYHTLHDSVPGAGGARESLWAMMRTVRDTGLALLNDDRSHDNKGPTDPVYFDVLGKWFVRFTQQSMLKFSIATMVFGPLLLWGVSRYASQTATASPARSARSVSTSPSSLAVHKTWLTFWTSFVLGLSSQALFIFAILKYNPYIVHSHPYTLLASTFSLSYLTTVPLLRLAGSSSRMSGLQLYLLTYILNGAATYALYKIKIGGVFFLIGWHFCAWLGYMVEFVRWSRERRAGGVNGAYGSGATRKGKKKKKQNAADGIQETRSSAIAETPLHSEKLWWILQALVSVPAPAVLMCQILFLFLIALGQTLTDGSSPIFIYVASSLLSFFVIIPLAPFSSMIPQNFTLYLAVIFVLSTTFNLTAFPFTTDAPMKVFFQQRVQLLPEGGLKAVTALTGVPYYLDKLIIRQLPSSWGRNVSCEMDKVRTRTMTCLWECDLLPLPGSTNDKIATNADHGSRDTHPLSINVTTLGRSSALVRLSGVNTRSCKLYFDNRNVTKYDVYDSSPSDALVPSERKLQLGYNIPALGISSIRLYSRSWNRQFAVKLQWGLPDDGAEDTSLKGRVACEWSEYESATRGAVWASSGGKIPAFEEALDYLPRWVAVTKLTDGLVEVWEDFEVREVLTQQPS